MNGYTWEPIEPLSDADRRIDLAAIAPLYDTWRTSQAQLKRSSEASLREFNKRLVRRLSVETGILERIYDIDRGTTEALVTHGFAEELVSRSGTDVEPSRLIDILRDQEAAIDLLMDCIGRNRELTKGVVHELHAILVRHQDSTTAVDQFGNRLKAPLLKGHFKQQPNNPIRPDGLIHEYCPPIHVDAEMERLLGWLSDYEKEDPVIVAAWFHHRFTQIHPYQDGNGRVARALTTYILLRARLLPLIIDRDLRVAYLDALETADSGDLEPLASLFANVERAAILQAFSVDVDAEPSHQRAVTSAVIESLTEKLNKRREAKFAELRRVNDVALFLRATAHRLVEETFNALSEPLSEIAEPDVRVTDGGPDHGNAHWYKYEVVQCASAVGKFANFAEDHYFVKASIRVARERLVLVTSFHHVGRELSGIMEATAFAQHETFEESEERVSVPSNLSLCSVEPFVFTYKTREQEITESFARWLDAATAVAIKEYGDRL